MRDLKYIIKRILIGVGIILVLSFFRGNKVKALEDVSSGNLLNVPFSVVWNSSDYTLIANNNAKWVYRQNNTNNIVACYSIGPDCEVILFDNFPQFKNLGISLYTGDLYGSSPNNIDIFLTSDSLPTANSGSNFTYNFLSSGLYFNFKFNSSSNSSSHLYLLNSNELTPTTYSSRTNYKYYSNISWTPYSGKTSTIIDYSPVSSSIESLQPTKITNNNVITGYIFRPKFTNFNTDNFVYQYKVGKDSTRWLSLNSNEQQIKINNNIELYVRIKDISSNDIIDSQTFTITDIGTFASEQDYNITFSGEYRTENFLNDNISSKSQSIIQEYQIYVDYIPKASILKYQYQYVNEGDSLDSNNWQNVASSDNGSFTYVASENGTLYARILDSSDNVLKTATFTVNNIGLLAFDSNENGVNNFFTKLSNKIGYGGPISNLFRIPIDILNKIYSYSSSSCSPYKISTLLGTDFILPCYNFREIFGNTYYTIFDSLLCFILSLCLFKFVRNIYDKFINMEDISS